MADEKAAGNQPTNASGNKSAGKSNRRRAVRSKRRSHKPEENSDARSETREPRVEQHPARGQVSAAKSSAEKGPRDGRERRRRRRLRAKQRGQNENATPAVDDTLKDLPPLVPAFVYTHVVRPSMRDSFEFRTEHFSKVTRRLEDFHIDLSPLYPEGGDEIKGVAWVPPADRSIFEDLANEEEADGENDGENDEMDGGDDRHDEAEAATADMDSGHATHGDAATHANPATVNPASTGPVSTGPASTGIDKDKPQDARAARRARRQAKRNAARRGGRDQGQAQDQTGGRASRQARADTTVEDGPVDDLPVDDLGAEIYDNPDWDADESADAARLDGAEGALADDFYGAMDDSVVDEYPEEDLDD